MRIFYYLCVVVLLQGCIDDYLESSPESGPSDSEELIGTPTGTAIGTESKPRSLPLVNSIADIQGRFVGAFRIGSEYTTARIAFNPDGNNGEGSLFVSTGLLDFGVKEIAIPELVNNLNDLSSLNFAATLQGNVRLLDKIPEKSWSSDPIQNRLMSLHYQDGKLLINGAIYYDAPGTDSDTTFRIETPSDLAASEVSGNFKMAGAQHLTKWTSPIPSDWQDELGSEYLMGAGPELAILSRLSIGPTLFTFAMDDLLIADNGDSITTTAVLDYPLETPLHADFLNHGGASGGENNDIFTAQSSPGYGFIVPGTRTYAVLGGSGGHNPVSNPYVGTMSDYANLNGTIFYKMEGERWTDNAGNVADGYSIYDHDDRGEFYWFYDLNDLLDADAPHTPKPYAYGYYSNFYSPEGLPSGKRNDVVSGSWDMANKLLYLSLPYVDRTYDGYSRNPVIVVLDFN